MSEAVTTELVLLIRAMKLGIWVAAVYDLLRIFRQVIKHNLWGIGVEDALYWCYVGVKFFWLLYEHNEGRLRWYLIAGATLGMFLYSITVGRAIVAICSKVIDRIKLVLRNVYCHLRQIIMPPFRKAKASVQAKRYAADQAVRQQRQKMRRQIKNKLTRLAKMIKIVLCKQ